MGYALFAHRKIFYTNLVFTLQSKLDNIMQQKQSILTFSANIADGQVTVEEMAQDASNFGNYGEFLLGAQEYIEKADADGGAGTTVSEMGSLAAEQNNSEEYLAAIADMLNQVVNERYAQGYNKKLEAIENQLDMEQKKIETKLTAAQQELQAIEDAEGQAIEKAQPKYSGVS